MAKRIVFLLSTLVFSLFFGLVDSSDAAKVKTKKKKPKYGFVECSTLRLKPGPVLLQSKPGGGFLCWSGPQPGKKK